MLSSGSLFTFSMLNLDGCHMHSPTLWLSADVLSGMPVPLTSVTSPFEATMVCSSLNATDFLCVDMMSESVENRNKIATKYCEDSKVVKMTQALHTAQNDSKTADWLDLVGLSFVPSLLGSTCFTQHRYVSKPSGLLVSPNTYAVVGLLQTVH